MVTSHVFQSAHIFYFVEISAEAMFALQTYSYLFCCFFISNQKE